MHAIGAGEKKTKFLSRKRNWQPVWIGIDSKLRLAMIQLQEI